MERRKRRSFTPEFRAEAVRLAREGSKGLSQVAKDLDLTESALRNWVRDADGNEGKQPTGALTGAEREELVRLRKENRQLQMERDFLKNSSRPVPHHLLRKKLGARFLLPARMRESARRGTRAVMPPEVTSKVTSSCYSRDLLGGAAVYFLVQQSSPLKNMVRGGLRTCEW